jgi:signal transduction histidine kinase
LTISAPSFLADISHEMRTPLTVMSSYAGLTKMQIKGGRVDTDTLENLDIIQHEAVRLGTMTEQIKLSSVKREQRHQETRSAISTGCWTRSAGSARRSARKTKTASS